MALFYIIRWKEWGKKKLLESTVNNYAKVLLDSRKVVTLQLIMETTGNNIESLIAAVLGDIRQKGYSSIQPFSVGKVEMRMIQFAQVNNITATKRTDKKEFNGKRYIKI